MLNDGLQAKVEDLFQKLQQLDTGERAVLKRCIGQKLNDASGSALAVFYKALPFGVSAWNEGRFFGAACLSCLWKAYEVKVTGRAFETCLKQVRLGGYESFDSRVRALLDVDWDDNDGYLTVKLARFAKQMRQKGFMPDFPLLLLDLVHWNDEKRWVQRKWARAYFGNGQISDKGTKEMIINGEEE